MTFDFITENTQFYDELIIHQGLGGCVFLETIFVSLRLKCIIQF